MASHFLGHPFRLTIATLKVTCAVHLAFTHGLQVSPAHGPSMLPTFTVDGDWIAADMTYRRGRRIKVGDLVLYNIPIFAHQQGVKRVIGMPGDYVSIRTPGIEGEDQMIQVDHMPFTNMSNSLTMSSSKVPEGHCWIVGDNLPASRDSRVFGPLPLALIQGKIIAKVLPWNERKWLSGDLSESK